MRRKHSSLMIAVLLSSLCLISCSNPEEDIVGKWKEVNGADRIEFSKDGTVSGTTLGSSFGGTYKFNENKELWMGTSGMYNGLLKVKISGDNLTLTDSNGMPFQYHREN